MFLHGRLTRHPVEQLELLAGLPFPVTGTGVAVCASDTPYYWEAYERGRAANSPTRGPFCDVVPTQNRHPALRGSGVPTGPDPGNFVDGTWHEWSFFGPQLSKKMHNSHPKFGSKMPAQIYKLLLPNLTAGEDLRET